MLGILLIALAVAVVFILLAAPLLVIINWWTSGRLDCLGAVGLGLVALVLLAMVAAGPAFWVRAVGWVGLALGALYAVYIWRTEGPSGHRAIEQRKVEQYTALVKANPANIPFRVELAQALYRLGREAEAIQQLEYAVSLTPDESVVAEERRMLDTWKEHRREKRAGLRKCPRCFTPDIEGHMDQCPRCGEPLTFADELTGWVESGRAARLLVALAGGLAIATAGYLISRFLPGFAGGLILFAAIAAAIIFVIARLPQAS
jgi:hypothetical protein